MPDLPATRELGRALDHPILHNGEPDYPERGVIKCVTAWTAREAKDELLAHIAELEAERERAWGAREYYHAAWMDEKGKREQAEAALARLKDPCLAAGRHVCGPDMDRRLWQARAEQAEAEVYDVATEVGARDFWYGKAKEHLKLARQAEAALAERERMLHKAWTEMDTEWPDLITDDDYAGWLADLRARAEEEHG